MLLSRRHPDLTDDLYQRVLTGRRELLENGDTISSTRGQTIAECSLEGASYVLKHYQSAHLLSRLRLLTGSSRADKAFRISAALNQHGVPTPRHLLVLKTVGLLGGEAFLLMERASGIPLIEFVQDPQRTLPPSAIENTARLVAGLHRAGIAHGDLHTRNILIDHDGAATLIDLDSSSFSRRRQTRDLDRFTRALAPNPSLQGPILDALEKIAS